MTNLEMTKINFFKVHFGLRAIFENSPKNLVELEIYREDASMDQFLLLFSKEQGQVYLSVITKERKRMSKTSFYSRKKKFFF